MYTILAMAKHILNKWIASQKKKMSLWNRNLVTNPVGKFRVPMSDGNKMNIKEFVLETGNNISIRFDMFCIDPVIISIIIIIINLGISSLFNHFIFFVFHLLNWVLDAKLTISIEKNAKKK